jgi:hypothetical protein
MNASARGKLTVAKVLLCLALNPCRHLLRRWNWKTSCLSALFRGILILMANLSGGLHGAVGAMLAESCYRALTSGFYSAFTQAFRLAQPVWAASAIPMILIPVVSDGFECIMHGMRSTQRLGATVMVSVTFTAVSTMFELFAMRHGVLVMGKDSQPLAEDLKKIPLLLIEFCIGWKRLFFILRRLLAFPSKSPCPETNPLNIFIRSARAEAKIPE